MLLRYGVIDTETTGLDTGRDEILQLCLYWKGLGDSFNLNGWYHTRLPYESCEGAYKVNKLIPEQVDYARVNMLERRPDAPKYFLEDVNYWQPMLNRVDVLIAHNMNYDAGMLTNAGVNLNNHKLVCTGELMQQLYPKNGRWSLKGCCVKLGIERDETLTHEASYDCYLTQQVFQKLSYMLALKELNVWR